MKTLRVVMLLIVIITGGMHIAPVYGALPADSDQRVFDYAGLFTDQDIAALNRVARSHTMQYLQDIVIVTVNDAQGKSAMDFADDFYDYNGFGVGPGYDGILLLIDMDNLEIFITTTGSAINVFNNVRINAMLDNIYAHVGNGAYAKSAAAFLNDIERYLSKPEAAARYWSWDFFGLGFCVVIIILGAMITRHKRGLLAVPSARGYINDDACNLADNRDVFLHSNIRRILIERDSDSSNSASAIVASSSSASSNSVPAASASSSSASSGSHARTSSSGRSHGGGGRKF